MTGLDPPSSNSKVDNLIITFQAVDKNMATIDITIKSITIMLNFLCADFAEF